MYRRSFFLWLSLLSLWIGALGRTQTVEGATTTGAAVDRIPLTPEEEAWISAHPVIRAGHDATYSPYAMQDAAGQIVGIDPDYLELIGRRTGLNFRNEVRSDWGKVIQDFKAGDLDILLSLAHTPDREAYLIYTDAYATAPNVIITRSDSPYLFALADLKERIIAIPRGATGLRADLELNVPGNSIVEYDSPAECYEAVAKGTAYAAVGEVANASYLINTHRWTNLRLGSVISSSTKLYAGVRKDWPMLAEIINKALAGMTVDDRELINNRWIAVDTSYYHRWAKAFKISAIVAAVAIVVFLLIFFHNRRLARELAERRKIQAELEQTRDRLVKASQEKSELMHMVAHDLRGPLTSIQLGVELLQMEPPLSPASRATTTLRVNESADQMARLISDLLSAQNVDEGRFALNYVAGDACYIAKAAMSSLSTVAQHKQIAIDSRLPSKPVALTTDFVAMQQVVDNLLSNALKYSPRGSRIEIAVAENKNCCRIEVRDQGPGVKPEEREKIFEKFGRGSAKPTQGEESIGLGLWIVRRFAMALNGTVWCESGPGGIGSLFIVEVPLIPPPPAPSQT
ncbi:MAG TPA: transporter substrate-binding domain-containing protein [Lacunisphaera sp.]|jgi:signal transduction histidine kinase